MTPKAALVQRTSVRVAASTYGEYREDLRRDFWFSCAYCSMTEVEAQGVRFTIDHYFAKSKNPELTLVYDNLMWCCDACNIKKGDDWPDGDLISAGFELFRPDVHHPDEHFALDGTTLEPLTPTGEFTAALLDLNRQALHRLRHLRQRLAMSQDAVLAGVRALLHLHPDRLPPAVRSRYLERVDLLKTIADRTLEDVPQMVEAWARSEMIDVDPNAAKRTKERRAWLKGARALAPLIEQDDTGE